MSASPTDAQADDAIVHLEANRFSELAQAALDNAPLRAALARATDVFAARRPRFLAEMPDWEALRTRAAEIKAETLARLDVYLEQFVAAAEARGVVVHWARDREEACRIVAQLAERCQARTVVKAKSMTSEEIGLNAALEARGLRAVETDLGEWILQLAGELPSHIIVPAIHKSKQDVARLFEEHLSLPPTDDVEVLCAAARKVLRAEFAAADLGISGVNFGVAENGTFLVLENEGNARMSTSLPRVHLALMGIEKVVPRLADLEVFLRLLPRSGTGQHLTTYQSLFTGPKRSPEDEGPEELHLLLLDNGRSGMLQSEVTRQTLACIRCGACLNVCPVYRQIGGHAYGSVYPGPIGAIVTPQLAGITRAAPLPGASSLCGACRDVCPVKIDIPKVLLHLRAEGVEAQPRVRRLKRLGFQLWAFAMAGRRRYVLAAWFGGPLGRVAAGSGPLARLLRRLAPPLGNWARGRSLPAPAKQSFRSRWDALEKEQQP